MRSLSVCSIALTVLLGHATAVVIAVAGLMVGALLAASSLGRSSGGQVRSTYIESGYRTCEIVFRR